MQGVFGRLFMCANVSGKPLGLRGHFHPAGLWISQLCHFDQSVWSLRLKDATAPGRRPSGGGELYAFETVHWGNVSCVSERRLWNPMKCPPSIRHPDWGRTEHWHWRVWQICEHLVSLVMVTCLQRSLFSERFSLNCSWHHRVIKGFYGSKLKLTKMLLSSKGLVLQACAAF